MNTQPIPGKPVPRRLPILFEQAVGKSREAAVTALRLRVADVARVLAPSFASLRRKWGGVRHAPTVIPDETVIRRTVSRMIDDLEERPDQNESAAGGIFIHHLPDPEGVKLPWLASIRVDDELYDEMPVEIREKLEEGRAPSAGEET